MGGLVGQIAKALGYYVVGIAGGVDYRADGLFKAIKRACPAAVDLYFDNVGGACWKPH